MISISWKPNSLASSFSFAFNSSAEISLVSPTFSPFRIGKIAVFSSVAERYLGLCTGFASPSTISVTSKLM